MYMNRAAFASSVADGLKEMKNVVYSEAGS